MPRRYKVPFSNASLAAVQDLFFVPGAANKMLRILRHKVGCVDSTIPTSQMIELRGKVLPATVTLGSGGTTGITPSKIDLGDAACSVSTAATNNTTQATTSGTATTVYRNGFHAYNGDLKDYEADGEFVFVGPSEAFVLELPTAASGTIHGSGEVVIEEYGG